MKDIVITGKTLKRELFVALGCFAIAFGMNVYAVLHYARPAIELISQIGFVVVIAAMIYLALWLPRLAILLVKKLF